MKRVFQSFNVTVHHLAVGGFALILLIGPLLYAIFFAKTIWLYFLMYNLSVCGLVLLITVLWEGFASYSFLEDRIVFRTPLHKETILKNEILFIEYVEVPHMAGDSVWVSSAIRFYDHNTKFQIELNKKTKPLLETFLVGLSQDDSRNEHDDIFSVYNRKFIIVLGLNVILFSLVELFVYLFFVVH